jgi:flagellar hook protein FlgE
MLGSIYIGLSGLSAYSRGLQTISNNVTNLNTLGFKATTFTFADSFSYGGLGSNFSRYVSGQQVGAGVRYGAEFTDFRQGDLRQTGGDLDLAIQGRGMLVLLNGNHTYYTRTGQFGIDKQGYVSLLGSNYRLGMMNGSGQAEAINIDANKTNPPAKTTKAVFADNLSSTATTATVADIAVYDAAGTKHVWKAAFTPVGAANPGEWTVKVTDEAGATVGEKTLKFIGSVPDPTTNLLTFTSGATSVDFDFSKVSSFSSGTVSSLHIGTVDGYGIGTLSSVTVNEDGQLKLTYSNEQTELLGAVALADFRDPQSLSRLGSGLFEDRAGGNARLLASGQEGIGTLATRQVEASNVDLSAQFGDLILVQRGFQASSQVVSVANDMIQQLFGIRGQG